jgi:ketosteroid isomerase-like protein
VIGVEFGDQPTVRCEPMGTTENKQIVRAAFDAWADGDGDFFRLLSDDVRWTITGTSVLAGTYTSRSQFLEAIRPIGARLSGPITPTVQSIVAEHDVVVVLWRGHATALDGQPYDNEYSWHMRLRDGAIVEVTAFLDTPTVNDLLQRVSLS